jgi:hypothetical protein
MFNPVLFTNDHKVELIIKQHKNENDVINFDQLYQSFSPVFPVKLLKKTPDFEYFIQNKNLSDQLKLHFQELSILNFKPTLLQIVLNEISIQKSHCI